MAVTGTNGKTIAVPLIANILSGQGLRVDMISNDRVFSREAHRLPDCSGRQSAEKDRLYADVNAAVLGTARGVAT